MNFNISVNCFFKIEHLEISCPIIEFASVQHVLEAEEADVSVEMHVDYPQSHIPVFSEQKHVLQRRRLLVLSVTLDGLSTVSKHSLLLIPTEYDPLTFTQTKHRHLSPVKTQAEQFKTEARTSILWF